MYYNNNQYPSSNSNLNSMQMQSDETLVEVNYNRSRIVQSLFDLTIIIVVFVAFGLVYFLVDPKIMDFTCDQSDIFFPYKADTIPFWAVGIYGTIGPIIIIILVEILNAKLLFFQKNKKHQGVRSFFICLFHALSLFILGIAITLLLTEIGKRWIGRLRPYFMSVCLPNLSSLNCTSATLTGIVYNAISTGGSFCTGNPSQIKEARFSFPSGHSSYSWFTMGFVIIYLEARLVLLRFRYLKTALQMTAFIAAWVTMLSRVSDYHHRGSDVIGGTVIGWIVALSITLVVGRVLWLYEKKPEYVEFDMKQRIKRRSLRL